MSLAPRSQEFKALLNPGSLFLLVLALMTPSITWIPLRTRLDHSHCPLSLALISHSALLFFSFFIPPRIWSFPISTYQNPMYSSGSISNDSEIANTTYHHNPFSFPQQTTLIDFSESWPSQNLSQLSRPSNPYSSIHADIQNETYLPFLQPNAIALFSPIPIVLYILGELISSTFY